MRRWCRAACFAAVLLLPPIACLADDWRVDEAKTRLLVLPLDKDLRSLWVDIPAELQRGCGAVAVRSAEGSRLRAVALRTAVGVVGLEIDLPGGVAEQGARPSTQAERRRSQAVQVYLLADAESKEASPPGHVEPIAVAARIESCVARPSTCAEYLTMASNRSALPWREHIREFPDATYALRLRARGGSSEKRSSFHAWRYRLSTTLVVGEDESTHFAVPDQDNGAWFLFVDEAPVFGWCEAERRDGWLVSPSVALAAGAHQLEFFGLLRVDESFPELRVGGAQAPSYEPLAAERLRTGHVADSMVIEQREAPLAAGLQMAVIGRYRFEHTEKVLTAFMCQDLSHAPKDGVTLGETAISVDGIRIPKLAAVPQLLLLPSALRHEVSIQLRADGQEPMETRLALREPWGRVHSTKVHFRLAPFPLLEPVDGVFAADYHLDAGEGTTQEKILSQAAILVVGRDAEGRELGRVVEPIPKSPFERRVHYRLPDTCTRIELAPVVQNFPVTAWVRIHRLDGSETKPDFRRSAEQLRCGDGFALLRRLQASDLEDLIPPQQPIESAVLVDDLIATRAHYQDDLDIVAWWREHELPPLTHFAVGTGGLAGQHPTLEKFEYLSDALASDRDAIIWAVGTQDILSGMDERDFAAQLLYLVRASLVHHKLPVLVTPPATKALPAHQIRPFALTVMETAATFDLPTVDLYSASLLAGGIDDFFRISAEAEVFSATPNVAGRVWFLERIRAALEAWNKLHD